MDPQELEPLLATLVRKDLLTLQADPRSPERGNYNFLQALVQRIAHDTLSRKEQKARHLAAARYFVESWGSDDAEIAEVTAAHYLAAYRAEPDEDLATLGAQLARIHWFTGNFEASVEPLEFALEIAESLFLPEVLSEALNTKNLQLINTGRRQESEALLRHSLRIAQEHGIQTSALRAQFNLAYHIAGEDRYEEAHELDREGLEQARRRGDRGWAWAFSGHFVQTNYLLGNWDELEVTEEEIVERLEAGTRARLDVISDLQRLCLH